MPRVRRSLPAVPQRGFSEPMQQTLLVNDLLSCGNVKEAILIDLKDFSYVSATPNFAVSDSDVTFLAMIFTKTNLRNTGFTLKSTKYAVSRRDSDAIYAKHEKGGMILIRTLKFHLVALYDDTMYPAICAEASNKLANYLMQKGY